jgi:DNA-binding beta-propeller fold protein YncE
VHGVAIAADLGRGFTSNGTDSSVTEFDLASLKVLHKITTGSGPDAIVYESGRQQIYTFDGRAQAATVIDARAARVLTQIALPDRPEFAVADAARGRVFDAIVDRDLIVAIDTQTHAVVASWPTPPCHGPSALALDGARHRLFVGCHNQTLLMMDDADGRVLASMPIGRGVDATAYDAGTRLVFSANGEGTVSVALAAANALQLLQTLRTQPGARTLALDPNTHRLYLAVADRAAGAAPPPTPGVGFRGPPPTVPGTFKLLVYGME